MILFQLSSPPILKSIDNTAPTPQFYSDLNNLISLSDAELKKLLEVLKASENYATLHDAVELTIPNETNKIQITSAIGFVYYFLLKLSKDQITFNEFLEDMSKVLPDKNKFNKVEQFFKSALELKNAVLNQDINYGSVNSVLPRWSGGEVTFDERLVYDEDKVIRKLPLLLFRIETAYKGKNNNDIIFQMTPHEAEYFLNTIKTNVELAKKMMHKDKVND